MKKVGLVVYPCFPAFAKGKQIGWTVGWLYQGTNSEKTVLKWGNFRTQEEADRILKQKYPKETIVYSTEPIPDSINQLQIKA